jgi:hypothetical protein
MIEQWSGGLTVQWSSIHIVLCSFYEVYGTCHKSAG